MCWITRKSPVLKTAEEDIKVFKIVRKSGDEIFSSYKSFPYIIGKLYETKIGDFIKEFIDICIYRGFHSYSNKCILEKGVVYTVKFNNRILDVYNCSEKVHYRVDCVIPKGSQYYENEVGEIVSNKIILKEIIDD